MVEASGYSTAIAKARCIVIHAQLDSDSHEVHVDQRSATEKLEEAVGLSEAISVDIVQARLFHVKKRTPRTLLGSGQVSELSHLIKDEQIELAIVNASLSPTQQRNLERAWKCKVIDRTALILEIFGERAQTAEGKLQVELASLNYQKSRLVRSWTHLERQRGGVGFMGGPGESQLETDRRLIANRITQIKQRLHSVVRTRALHRKPRQDAPFPLVALVGYTNAGKSTLFNRLTGAKVMQADQLFATLDPTIRAIRLPSGQQALISDTVGFISDLPHELVAAFRATLEEVAEADLLLHVRDASHPQSEAQALDVYQVLEELLDQDEDQQRPVIEVMNKCDQIEAPEDVSSDAPPLHYVSALTGEGCQDLLEIIDQTLQHHQTVHREYHLPVSAGKAMAWLHAHGFASDQRMIDDSTMACNVSLRPTDAAAFERSFAEDILKARHTSATPS